ncbi:glycosyltransferase [Candidatus Saccharibacteria bacterium]|nr:glycosyltransferase [Candidatus Saccharibacteria bacterium]
MAKEESSEEYIRALEEELMASIEREEKLSNEDLKIRPFVMQKIKRTKLYKNVISDPDSKSGKLARAPRTIYRMIRNPEVRKSLLQKKTANGKIIEAEKVNSLEPWTVSLKTREKIARESLKDGRKLVLYFVDKPDSSTFRYRCYNTFQATLKSKKWQAVYFFRDEVKTFEELLSKSSLVIMGRQSGQTKIVEKIVELAHKNKIKVGLDVDDLVFDMKYLDLMLDAIGEKTNKSYWAGYCAGVQAIAKQMDFFVTTNKFLMDKIKKSYNKPCVVIRNSLNQEQVDASLAYTRLHKKHDGFKIGYFSGSPTHAKDFAVAEPEVIRFLEEHDDATLNVVGYMRFSKKAEKLADKKKIKFLPMVDFRKLQRLMAEVDVNIAPLQVNDFTNCKSELKFFEAAAVETTTIASPTYTFSRAITDGENGFLAKPGEWYDKLEYLYKNPSENIKIAKAARKYALENYYGEKFLKEVEEAYDSFMV